VEGVDIGGPKVTELNTLVDRLSRDPEATQVVLGSISRDDQR
jgi:hypothetical protein